MATVLTMEPSSSSPSPTPVVLRTTNPMSIPNVVEAILKRFHQNFHQLKELRLVNRVWRDEVTRLILKIGYIQLPPNYHEKSEKARKRDRKALQTLLQNNNSSSATPRFPINLHILSSEDLPFFHNFYLHTAPMMAKVNTSNNKENNEKVDKTCGKNPRDFLLSIKMDCHDLSIELFQKFLKEFPNLQEFQSLALDELLASQDEEIWRIIGDSGKGCLIRKLHFDLRFHDNYHDLDDDDYDYDDDHDHDEDYHHGNYQYMAMAEIWIKIVEKLADSINLQEIWIDVGGGTAKSTFKNRDLEKRVKDLLLKLLKNSQKSLDSIKLGHPLGPRLNSLDFPALIFPKVKTLHVAPYGYYYSDSRQLPAFPKGVTFQKNFPNLEMLEMAMQSDDEDPVDPCFLLPPEDVGVAPNVQAMTILGYIADMSRLSQMAPNLKILILRNIPDFCRIGRSIWTHCKGLQYIDVHFLCLSTASYFPYFDAVVCGFSAPFVQHLDQTGRVLMIDEVPRENPSIFDLKDLKVFNLAFNCLRMREIPSGFKIVSPVMFHYLKRQVAVRFMVSVGDEVHKQAIESSFKPVEKWCSVVVQSRT